MQRYFHWFLIQKKRWISLMAQMVKNLPAVQETQVQSLSQEDPLEEEMATHSNILAWGILWTEEPCGLQSMGFKRVGHDWTRRHTLKCICYHMQKINEKRKWNTLHNLYNLIKFVMRFHPYLQLREALLSIVRVRPVNHQIKTQDTERWVHYNHKKKGSLNIARFEG